MQKKIEFYGQILNGKLDYYSPIAREFIDRFYKHHEGKEFKIQLKIVLEPKTQKQLGFYFGALIPAFVKATGETDRDKIDNYLKWKYLSYYETFNGKTVPQKKNKRDLDIKEMSDFIECCFEELADCGGRIEEIDIINYMAI